MSRYPGDMLIEPSALLSAMKYPVLWFFLRRENLPARHDTVNSGACPPAHLATVSCDLALYGIAQEIIAVLFLARYTVEQEQKAKRTNARACVV